MFPINEAAQEEIRNAKLILLNSKTFSDSWPNSAFGNEDIIIAGSSLNIPQVAVDAIQGKGIMVHLPYVTAIDQSAFYQTIDSNQLKTAKFVILSLEIPETLTGMKREEFLENRNKILKKLCEDYRVEKPVFVTINSLDQSKLAPLSEASINLQQMLPQPWKSSENENDPVVALLGTSNAHDQKTITTRIEKLVERGFCVKVPQYLNGELLVEEIEGRKTSNVANSFSPAVSARSGANQIIECIRNKWNIMPYMGGESLEEKIPLVVEYFSENPGEKDPSVKFFGMSNSTYATALASQGICSFISTPFTNIFLRANDSNFDVPAQNLEAVLKGQEVTDFPRTIICNPDEKLNGVDGNGIETFHYPLNLGNVAHELYRGRLLNIPAGQSWSISVEGFLQKQGSLEHIKHADLLKNFLEQSKGNLPAFIEIGNIATRRDGQGGYANLLHDNLTGQILVEDYNIDKIFSSRKDLKDAAPEVILREKENIAAMLQEQNIHLQEVINSLRAVCEQHKVPLIGIIKKMGG